MGNYGYRSGMLVQIGEWVQIRDRVQIRVLHIYIYPSVYEETYY